MDERADMTATEVLERGTGNGPSHGAVEARSEANVKTDRVRQGWTPPRTATFDFGDALRCLRAGYRVARLGWNGRGQYIELQTPTPSSKMTLPYIYIHTVRGDLVPWLASQTDLLASDWTTVSEVTRLSYGPHGIFDGASDGLHGVDRP